MIMNKIETQHDNEVATDTGESTNITLNKIRIKLDTDVEYLLCSNRVCI